jgi:general secretion pathway protein H
MRTSAAGRAEGFTLVELLVVLTIIGLMSAAVMLALPDSRGSVADEAERFAARARAAQEQAILANRPVAMRVTGEGYGFERSVDGEWQPIDEKPFAQARWTKGTKAVVEPAAERIVFDSTGFAEPLSVTLTRAKAHASVEIADGGRIHVGR